MIFPLYDEFVSLAKDYDIIPVYTRFLADTETPITVFQKLVGSDTGCLLESAAENKYLGRYSFIGYDPMMMLRFRNGKGHLSLAEGPEQEVHGEPLTVLKELLSRYRFCLVAELPRFYGGAVGYLAFEALQSGTDSLKTGSDELGIPDCHLFFPKVIIIFDHLYHQLTIVVNCLLKDEQPAGVYRKAVAQLKKIQEKLAMPLSGPGPGCTVDPPQATVTDHEFQTMVARGIDCVKEGRVDQVVVSRRFSCNFQGDDFLFYRRLRSINPSPYMYYLNLGDMKCIGSSPEMLLRVEEGRVTTCPIAGTRRRGETPEEDRRLAAELLADPKELKEHEILVEFAVRDLERICAVDSVEITGRLEPQFFSHVIHLTSRVEGRLKGELHPVDALAACFPAGTVSGSPREEAMRIIAELEPGRRGVYGGAVGYFGFNHTVDTAIAIRTLIVKDGRIYIQAGAGVVADSVPARELEEVNEKARGMFKALSINY